MTFSSNPSIVPLKVNKFPGVNREPIKKSKGIQCRESEGYGHIQEESTNICKKSKSYTVTWSDEETKEREDPFSKLMVLISLATIEDPSIDVI